VATPEEIKRAKELEAIEASRRDIAREMQGITASQAYTRDSVSQAASLTDYARQLTEEMKEQAGIRRGRSEVDKSLLSLSQQLQQSAQRVTSELGNEYKVQQQLVKDRELQRKIEIEIANVRNSMATENSARVAEIRSIESDISNQIREQNSLKAKQEGNQLRLAELKREGGHLNDKEIEDLTKTIELDKTKLENLDQVIAKRTDELDIIKASTPASEQRLNTLYKQLDTITDIQGIRQAELQTQREITKATGVTGAVVGGLGGIMQRLGMRSGIFNQAMDDSKEAMEAMAGEGIKAGKAVSKLAVAMKGVGILADAASKVLSDPAVIVGAIVDGFFNLNNAGVQFGQMTGQAADAMHGVSTEVSTAVDLLNTATGLTREIGLNAAAIFSPQQVGQISDAVTLLGLGEAAAGRLGLMMNITGKSADQLGESVYETVSGLNEAGKSAVAPRQVLDDVLTASEDITLSLGNNVDKLADAATAARRFGMNLSQVDKIAEGLLDFESSIEAELEAQLLTGKNINMAKARELALSNDLAGLAKELERQGVSAVEFSKMNRIQQEATAKALGMSRQELSKSLLTQEAQANMTEEQLAAARGVTLEESKRISIQERLQKAIEKLQLAFAPVLEAVVPIVETVLTLAEPILAAAGGLGKFLASLIKIKPIMFALKGAAIAFSAVFAGKTLTNAIANLTGLTAKQVAYNAAVTAGYSDAQIAYGFAGKAAKDSIKLSGLQTAAAKLQTAAQTALNFVVGLGAKLVKGLGNAFLYSVRGIGMATKALGLNSLAQSAWNLVTKYGSKLMKISGIEWLAQKARVMADTGAKLLNFKATAAVNTANTAAGPAAAKAASGFAAAGAGLGAFGAAAAPAVPIILAIGGALLMASPAIYALGLMITGLAEVIGNVLMKALEMLPSIIDAVAQGFVTMLGAVTLEKVAALALMGPALMSVAAGLSILSASMFTAIPAIGMLGAIALMGPGLTLAGEGISKMAEGVAKLSAAIESLETEKLKEVKDLVMTTALAAPAVAASGAITSLIQGITGQGGDNTDAKLDELIAAVREGHIVDIYLDGEKISRQQALTATTLS